MGRITKLQNDIATLQAALADRNNELADLKRKYSAANEASQKTINELRNQIETLKTAEAA